MHIVSTILTHELIEMYFKTGAEIEHCRVISGLPQDSVLKSAHVNECGDLTITFETAEALEEVVVLELECIVDKVRDEDDIPF